MSELGIRPTRRRYVMALRAVRRKARRGVIGLGGRGKLLAVTPDAVGGQIHILSRAVAALAI